MQLIVAVGAGKTVARLVSHCSVEGVIQDGGGSTSESLSR